MGSGTDGGYVQFGVRSIGDRAYWERVAREGKFAPLLAEVREVLEKVPGRPVMPFATDYLAAKRSNDRARLDHLWQEGRMQLGVLAFDRCLKGIEANDPDDRLLDWLWAHVTEPTWVVSAHLPGNDLPASGRPQLDLAACEMAANLAETREALKPWMDSVSATLADTIVAEIDRRVLEPFARLKQTWWFDKERGEMHNWVGVCAGSILAACESLAKQGYPRPEAKAWALQCLRDYLAKGFTPHGECDEGVGYWSYGMGFASMGWGRLSRAELWANVDMERLRRVADYPRRAHLFANKFFAKNDAGSTFDAPLYFVPWLAGACEMPWLTALAGTYPSLMHRNFSMLCRVVFAVDSYELRKTEVRSTEWPRLLEDQQAGLFRIEAAGGEMIACLTGGNNQERHNHNDLGHFLLAYKDRFIIPDMGAPRYTADFFGPRRYTYLSASSRGHNCPLINGQEQRAGRDAAGQIVEWKTSVPRLSLDLTSAYPAEAGLLSWTRTMQPQGSTVVLTDNYRTRADTSIVHTIWSTVEPKPAGAGKIRLAEIECQLSPAPVELKITSIQGDDQRLRDYSGQTLWRIEATYKTVEAVYLSVQTVLSVAG